MFVSFIMNPLVEKYKKVFDEEVMLTTAGIREAHTKIKQRM